MKIPTMVEKAQLGWKFIQLFIVAVIAVCAVLIPMLTRHRK